MALALRKVRTDQREQPRDLSVDFALPYPVECPALVTDDDVRRAWSVLFWPAFAAGNVVTALHVTTDNGKTWPTVRRKEPSLEYVRSAVEAHLNAGKTGKPWHLDGEGEIHAIGVRFAKDEPTCIMNVDLDGGVDPVEFVRSMRENGVYGVLASSSGKPGRFRYLVFLDRWYTVDDVQRLGKTLCESLGFKVKKRFVEIYPSTVNGREPCGYGALTVFDPAHPNDGLDLTLRGFLRTFFALPRVNIASIVYELTSSIPIVAEHPEREQQAYDFIFPEMQRLGLESARQSNDTRKTMRAPERGRHVTPPDDIVRWKNKGFHAGERERGLYLLAMHAWFQKKNHKKAVDWLIGLVRRGLLRRSKLMTERPNAIAYQIKDLPRIVRDTFAICATFRVTKAVNADLAHLTEDDFAVLDADVQRVATQDDRTWTAKRCKALVWYIVRFFKGAMVAGHVDNEGRPIARIHWIDWQIAAGNRSDYKAIRDALGWFVPIIPEGSPTPNLYCSRARAKAEYGDELKAHATTYAFVPRLTCEVPKRALAPNWDDAVKVATKRLSKRAKTG